RFLQWLSGQGWQAPVLVEAALKAVRDRRVEPYSHEELLAWCRAREAENAGAEPGAAADGGRDAGLSWVHGLPARPPLLSTSASTARAIPTASAANRFPCWHASWPWRIASTP